LPAKDKLKESRNAIALQIIGLIAVKDNESHKINMCNEVARIPTRPNRATTVISRDAVEIKEEYFFNLPLPVKWRKI
jgi:hypothetical protein